MEVIVYVKNVLFFIFCVSVICVCNIKKCSSPQVDTGVEDLNGRRKTRHLLYNPYNRASYMLRAFPFPLPYPSAVGHTLWVCLCRIS